ncbi:MAG: PQQ-binding-like beta-propeller repeat protein [Planctomycetota bacterium]|nr:PQQ-binding-like beta-propeller repeat protein [Planctomycetota bacterium]MDA1141281.1 PQQ-binding-like beta-propeller repeat protein [Planctomycetota bacterium]
MSFLKIFSVVFFLLSPSVSSAADWTRFRGPDGAGKSSDTGLPETWDATTNIKWKTELPGPGASSPVTFGEKIYVTCFSGYTTADGDQSQLKLHLVALNRADGKIAWDTSFAANTPEQVYKGFVELHGYASGTPAVDATGIYTFFGRTGAIAFNHEGKELWRTSLGTSTHSFGSANSPIIYKDLVIINAGVESGSLVALDKKTGAQVWTQPGMNQSWNTPIVVTTPTGDELVVNTQGAIKAFDPAKGTPLWTCNAINDYICPSVIANDGIIYAIGGRSATAVAVKAGGRGDVTATHKLWQIPRGSNVPSLVFHEDHLYWVNDSGIAICVNAKDGAVLYQERLVPKPRRVYSSVVLVDGRIYATSRQTGAYVMPAKPEFKLLAHNAIADDNSVFNGSLVVSNGQFLTRSDKFLYCIGK